MAFLPVTGMQLLQLVLQGGRGEGKQVGLRVQIMPPFFTSHRVKGPARVLCMTSTLRMRCPAPSPLNSEPKPMLTQFTRACAAAGLAPASSAPVVEYVYSRGRSYSTFSFL